MRCIPNNETVRHLCHYHGASQYYLLADKQLTETVLVTDVKDKELLREELRSWCGMEILVFDIKEPDPKAAQAIKQGIPLHLAADSINLIEK